MIETLGPLALFSLAAVVFIGLPHGAMDGAVAMVSGYGQSRGAIIKFIVQYILMAGLVVLVWVMIPVFSLTMFMLYSLVHFGLGDALPPKAKPQEKTKPKPAPTKKKNDKADDLNNQEKRLLPFDAAHIVQIICHGGLVVVVIPLAHLQTVQPIFDVLTGGADLAAFWSLILAMVLIFAIATVIYTIMALVTPGLRRRWIEFALLAGLMIILPPLTGFALYFCCVHTPRHIGKVINAVKAFMPDARILPLTFGFTIATWAVMLVAIFILGDQVSFDAAMVQVIFIGLAALTVPHMMLVDGAFRRKLNRQNITSAPPKVTTN